MKHASKLTVAIGLALGLGLAATAINARPYGAGWGPGSMMGAGPGAGCPAGAGYGTGPGHGMGPGYGMGPGNGMGFGRPGATDNPAASVENRLAGMKSALKITPAQEGAWTAYAEQAKQQAESAQKWRSTMHDSAPAALPERIELRDKVWKERQAQAETMTQKVNDLYAALTPEQKPIADRLFGGLGPRAGFGPGYRYR